MLQQRTARSVQDRELPQTHFEMTSSEEKNENNYTESPVIYSMQSNPDSVDAEHTVNPSTRVMSAQSRLELSASQVSSTDHGLVTDDSDVLKGQATGVSQRPQIPRLISLEKATPEIQIFSLNQDSERTDRDTSPEPVWRLPCDICGEKNHSEMCLCPMCGTQGHEECLNSYNISA